MSVTEEERLSTIYLVRYYIDWLSRSFASGYWKSWTSGAGFDYRGQRPYAEDPDLRRVDWARFATTGDLNVHVFAEERSVDVTILANLCPSMAFGTRTTKRVRLAVFYQPSTEMIK